MWDGGRGRKGEGRYGEEGEMVGGGKYNIKNGTTQEKVQRTSYR